MDEAIKKSGEWPNVALVPGTYIHAATGERVERSSKKSADMHAALGGNVAEADTETRVEVE